MSNRYIEYSFLSFGGGRKRPFISNFLLRYDPYIEHKHLIVILT